MYYLLKTEYTSSAICVCYLFPQTLNIILLFTFGLPVDHTLVSTYEVLYDHMPGYLSTKLSFHLPFPLCVSARLFHSLSESFAHCWELLQDSGTNLCNDCTYNHDYKLQLWAEIGLSVKWLVMGWLAEVQFLAGAELFCSSS